MTPASRFRSLRVPSPGWLIRVAVILELIGLPLVAAVLLTINALAVGLYMLGSVLITLGILLYMAAVIIDLRQRRAL